MKLKVVLFLLVCSSWFVQCNSQQKATVSKSLTDTGYTYNNKSVDGIGKFYMGREIAHVMGAAGSEWLERDDRNKEENTQLAIEKIDLPLLH